ncbi:MAG: MerR family transcriptional regulator [Rhizobiales bacterium]|nr:MerR family transcriptional regulator [Hyphomicrobiales bacterium]
MDKAPEAFRTISEVAEELDVPQHVLRFWETRFSQIKPMKRGGGRRYYRPSDVDLLKGIRTLLYGQGYTIRGVQRILREAGMPHVAGIGRGEIEPDSQNEADEAPAQKAAPKVVRAEEKKVEEPKEQSKLSAENLDQLRQALNELAAAKQLLGVPHD